MIVYRICKEKYCRDFSGKGAELVGGRWNSIGLPAIYTSCSIALCTVEVTVHLPLGIIPQGFVLLSMSVPDQNAEQGSSFTELTDIPGNWRSYPFPVSTQIAGDKFLRAGKFLGLKVPSAVVNSEFNYIINPQHPEARQLKIMDIQPYEFDQRLFTR